MEITVYGTTTCPHCVKVKNFLDNKATDYEYQLVGTDLSIEQLEESVGRPVRTVPVIVVDGDELSFDSLKMKVDMSVMEL